MDPTLEPLRGLWVAIGDEGDVVADAGSLTELHALLSTTAPDRHVIVRRIPDLDDPFSIGVALPAMA